MTPTLQNSTQAFVNSRESKYIKDINSRVAQLTGVPEAHQEDVQVLRYELDQVGNHENTFRSSCRVKGLAGTGPASLTRSLTRMAY
jgi:hypothetical protein